MQNGAARAAKYIPRHLVCPQDLHDSDSQASNNFYEEIAHIP